MAVKESKLIISLIDRASAPARAIGATLRGLNDAVARNNAALSGARMQMIDAVGAAYALAKAVGSPLQSAIEFESAMADVRKVVDFPTPDAFAEMSKDIVELSKLVPMAATGLAHIAAEAGASGIPTDEIVAYTEMVAKLGVAFDMTAEAVGEDMTKIKTALGLSLADTSALADSFNHLSNSMASKAPQIIDFMKRVGSSGRQYGFTAEQTAAIGSAMISAGAEADVAATSFRNVGRSLTRGNQISKAQAEAFRRLGLTSMQVTKRMQKDATGTFRDVIERIRKLPKHLQASTISQIFGDEARAIAPLIDNLGLYDDALKMVADRVEYLGSSQKEYDSRAATTANNVQLFRNRLAALGITIGSALLPGLNDALKVFGPMVDRVARLAEKYPALTRAVVMTIGGFTALRIAAIALKFSFLWLKGGLLATAIAGLRGVAAAAALASLALMPFRVAMAGAARALALFALSARIGGIGTALTSVAASALATLNPMRLAAAAVRGLGVALRFAFMASGIGAVIAAIAAAGIWIYQNWNGIGEMFSSFGQAFMEALGPARPLVEGFASAVSSIWEAITGLLGPVDESGESWRAWGKTLGEIAGGGVKSLIDGLSTIGGWLSAIVDRAGDAIGAVGRFLGLGGGDGGATPSAVGRGASRIVPPVSSSTGGWSGYLSSAADYLGFGSSAAETIPVPDISGAAGAVEQAGTAAGADIEDGAARGADALTRAADRLEQALRDGAAALSNVRVPMPVANPMRTGGARPDANLGISMPNAGLAGSGG